MMNFDLPQLHLGVVGGCDPIGQPAEVPVVDGVSVVTEKSSTSPTEDCLRFSNAVLIK